MGCERRVRCVDSTEEGESVEPGRAGPGAFPRSEHSRPAAGAASIRASLIWRRGGVCMLAVLGAATIAACGSTTSSTSTATAQAASAQQAADASLTVAPTPGKPACGAAAPGVLATAVGQVAKQIYAREVASFA